MSTFSMACHSALEKCGPVLEEAPALFDKAANVMVELGQKSNIPKITQAGEALQANAAEVKKQLAALTATYEDAKKDYHEVGVNTGALEA